MNTRVTSRALLARERESAADMVPGGLGSAPLVLVDDDQALVARIRAGDDVAFEAMFRHHYRGLLGFARSLVGTMAEAEEIVQDVLAGVWANRGTWTVHAGVAGYLYGAVRNRCVRSGKHADVVRRWADRVAREAGEGSVADGEGSTPGAVGPSVPAPAD